MSATPAFSHSRLSMLDDCPRRYGWRYVEKRREAFDTIEAFRGQVAHAALAWLYTEREEARSPSADELVARYRDEWAAKHSARVRVIRDLDLPAGEPQEEAWLAEGEPWLRQHHAMTFTTDRRTTIATEPKVRLAIEGRSFLGYVDRLAQAKDGQLHVIDYKTGRRVPQSFADVALQVQGYGAAVLESHGGEAVGLEYDYLQTGQHLKGTLTREGSSGVRALLGERIDAALAAEEAGVFKAKPGPLCAWCGFREACDVSGFAAAPSPTPGGAALPCPRCGAELRLREGRRGPFIGCSAHPECSFTRDARPDEVPVARGDGETSCPRCGKGLRLRSGRNGDFVGCTGFPACRYSRDARASDPR